MNQTIPILAVAVWVITFLLYRPTFFRRPLEGNRRWLLALLQVVPLLLLVWLLGNPFSERRKQYEREGTVVVLVDDSPSMGMEDGVTGRPRAEIAEEWVRDFLAKKKQEGQPGKWVRYGLDELIPEGKSGSDFAAALKEVGRRIPQQLLEGVLFLSDGRDRSEGSLQGAAKSLGVPLHTLGLGPETSPGGVRVRWKQVPERVNPGSPFLAQWAIDSELSRETLHHLHIAFASEEIHQESLNLPEGPEHSEGWVTIRPETPGKQSLKIRVFDPNAPDSQSIQERTVTVNAEPKTLLVLESQPSRLVQSLTQIALESGRFRLLRPVSLPEGGGVVWDLTRPFAKEGESVTDFWKQEAFTRFGPGEWTNRLPTLLEEVSVVILGRTPLSRFPGEWVEALKAAPEKNRCGWLVLPGSEHAVEQLGESGLATLLEREGDRRESRESLRLLIDEQGKNHPALAPLWSFQDGVWEIGRDSYFRTGSQTTQPLLNDTQSRNLVVQVPFALGRATLVSTSNLWKLRSYAGQRNEGARESDFLTGLWLGILDDLAGRETGEITLRTEPDRPTLGQSAQIQVQDPSIRPGPPRGGLELRKTEGVWQTLLLTPDPDWPGIAKAVWTPRLSGEYEIRYASGETPLVVSVSERPSEGSDIAMNRSVLQDLAQVSGGTYSRLSDLVEGSLDLEPRVHPIEKTEKTPLRHDVWIGILAAGLFCLGWGLRRAWSLP